MANNDAYHEGYDAYWDGVDVSDNPYEEGTDGHCSWEKMELSDAFQERGGFLTCLTRHGYPGLGTLTLPRDTAGALGEAQVRRRHRA